MKIRTMMEKNVVTSIHRLSLKKRLIFASAVTIVSGLLAMAVAEMFIRRTSDYVTPEIIRNRSLQYAPALFARHVFPQKELTVYSEEESYRGEYYINEKGYRGHSFSVPKPQGVIRIVFYGGSATFDLNLPEGHDWPHRVETILKQSGYPAVEVINAGIPGHASFDSFGRLFSEGHVFSPDYVVSYNEWNDIKYFRSTQPLLREFKPFCPGNDPRFNYRSRLDRFLCEHSQLFVRLRIRYYDWRLAVGPEGNTSPGPYSSEISETALRQYTLNQQMFVDLAREIGAVPILMTEARLAVPGNTEREKSRIEYDYVKFDHETLLKAYDRIEEAVRRISSAKSVDLIDVSEALDGRDEYFSDVVHLTPRGSEELAQLTARKLIEILKTRSRNKISG